MKRMMKIIFCVTASLILLASAATATTINVGDWVKLIAYNPLDSAGIMTYAVSKVNDGTTDFTYDTFCIQDNVYVVPGTWYPIADISTTVGLVVNTNPPLAGAGPLNGAVDYLFYQYSIGAYAGSLTTHVAETDFQKLLWSLQGSGPSYSSSGYKWSTDLIAYNSSSDMQKLSYGTKVLNIVSNGQDIQNQLYHAVPEPSTMILLGTGLACLVAMRRRRKQ